VVEVNSKYEQTGNNQEYNKGIKLKYKQDRKGKTEIKYSKFSEDELTMDSWAKV
jgi:hypothetical protein